MKIIEDAPTPNSRRVRVYLAEKGIDVEFEQISIMDKKHLTQDFATLNPWHRVPVLVLDDGNAISETIAICRYFEAQNPSPSLFGDTPLQQAAIEMWNRRMELSLFFEISQCFRHLHPKMAELEVPQVEAWGKVNRDRAVRSMELLDVQLGKHPYVAGNAFSVADITGAIAINFLKPAKLEVSPEHVNLARWFADVKARPSWDV